MKTQHQRHNANVEKNGTGQRMQADIGRGVTAWFDIGGSVIEYWASTWTGREVVRVDGQVVSDRRSWSVSTIHQFEHQGVAYSLVFRIKSLLKGNMEIELYRDGELVDSDTHTFNGLVLRQDQSVDWKRSFLKLLPYFIGGGIFGAAAATAWLGFDTAGWFQ